MKDKNRMIRRFASSLSLLILLFSLPVTALSEEAEKYDHKKARKDLNHLLMQIMAQGEEAAKNESPELQEAMRNLKARAMASAKDGAVESRGTEDSASETPSDPNNPFRNPFDDANGELESLMKGLGGMGGAYMGVLGAAAKAERSKVASKSPSDPRIGKASLLAVGGKTAEAIALYEQVIQESPENSSALFGYASVLASSGKSDDALAALERAVTFDPRYAELAARDQSFSSVKESDRFKTLTQK